MSAAAFLLFLNGDILFRERNLLPHCNIVNKALKINRK